MSEASIVAFEVEGKVVVARVTCNTVSERESSVILEEAEGWMTTHGHRLAIDLTAVTMLASMGLGALVRLNQVCTGKGGRVVVYGLNDDIRGLLKLTRLDSVLRVAKDRDGAVRSLA